MAGSSRKPSFQRNRRARSVRSGSSSGAVGEGEADDAGGEILLPAGGIEDRHSRLETLAGGHAHRVDGQVAGTQVLLHGAAEWGEVHLERCRA